MSDAAYKTQYRNETIAGFEQRQSLLRDTTTTEAVINGNTAVFLVADSGGATAVTRNPATGLIPGRPVNNTQNSCVLTEYQDKPVMTGFNVFASQGNQMQIMQQTSMGVINRSIDSIIVDQLATATITTGSAAPMSPTLFGKAQATLGANSIPWDGWITLLLSPGALAQMQLSTEFANVQYVDVKPNVTDPSWRDKIQAYRWRNVMIISHPLLANLTTPAAEVAYMYHRSAIGHAANVAGMQAVAGYVEEDDYSYARTGIYMGAKLLQNSGVIKINTDSTGQYGS